MKKLIMALACIALLGIIARDFTYLFDTYAEKSAMRLRLATAKYQASRASSAGEGQAEGE